MAYRSFVGSGRLSPASIRRLSQAVVTQIPSYLRVRPDGMLPMRHRRQRFFAIAVAALIGSFECADATYFNYEQWEALPQDLQTFYIAGAVDSLITYARSAQELQKNKWYESCLMKAQMTDTQLAQNVRNYGAAHPEVQTQLVQYALVAYLMAACGSPPP
jgi:hypothetical protein